MEQVKFVSRECLFMMANGRMVSNRVAEPLGRRFWVKTARNEKKIKKPCILKSNMKNYSANILFFLKTLNLRTQTPSCRRPIRSN